MIDISRESVNRRLNEWLGAKDRLPLLLRGARQVGKSYAVRSWAEQRFGSQFLEINLEERRDLHSIFKRDLKIERIIDELQLVTGVNLLKPRSLLFLDEIQTVPEALMSLRYFYERYPELPVIAAGSLVDFVLSRISFPVGRVESYFLGPIPFGEFIAACGKTLLASYYQQASLFSPVPESLHQEFLLELRKYFFVGGMPAAVRTFIETADLKAVAQVHSRLLTSYEDDFAKYSRKADWDALRSVFRALGSAVSANRVVYAHLDRNLRIEKTKRALALLDHAHLCTRVISSTADKLPLQAGSNRKFFKILFLDIGLLQHQLGFDWRQIAPEMDLTTILDGKFAEQFVGQELLSARSESSRYQLHYWLRTVKGSEAEVDYLMEGPNGPVPLEVKAGSRGTLKSLRQYELEHPAGESSGLSQRNVESLKNTRWVPLYLAGRL